MERSEEKTRLVLTDTDLKGRDVLTIITENKEIELLEHKYVEKLADEVWDGPIRVERSPFWLCSSGIALSQVFEPLHTLEDPLTLRDSFGREREERNKWNKLSAWGFGAWKEGMMVRYGVYIYVTLFLTIYCMWFMFTLNSMINRLN